MPRQKIMSHLKHIKCKWVILPGRFWGHFSGKKLPVHLLPVAHATAALLGATVIGLVVVPDHLEGGAVVLANGSTDIDGLFAQLHIRVLGKVDLVGAQVVVPLNDNNVAILDHRHFTFSTQLNGYGFAVFIRST